MDIDNGAAVRMIDHTLSVREAIEAFAETHFVLDIDLAILGAAPAQFARYDAGIRPEYIHVPLDVYTARRREVLSSFLKRDRLYLTDWAHGLWETRARRNLEMAIAG